MDVLLTGLAAGSTYALIATGVSLVFGVSNIVNFAHGSFLMLSMYIAFWLHHWLGWDPYASALVAVHDGLKALRMLKGWADAGEDVCEKLLMVFTDAEMPEMDGYQTMEVIRKKAEFRRLPIIALTAKAMKGDREKCLEAGASDYLAKPVNTEQLLSALRMWLHR